MVAGMNNGSIYNEETKTTGADAASASGSNDLLAVEANMALNEDMINSLHYFLTEKEVDRWTRWEEHKDEILQELPLLKLYLEKERELGALGRAVQRELEDYNYS